jgi:hypothetical protein
MNTNQTNVDRGGGEVSFLYAELFSFFFFLFICGDTLFVISCQLPTLLVVYTQRHLAQFMYGLCMMRICGGV